VRLQFRLAGPSVPQGAFYDENHVAARDLAVDELGAFHSESRNDNRAGPLLPIIRGEIDDEIQLAAWDLSEAFPPARCASCPVAERGGSNKDCGKQSQRSSPELR
jgi:hypothetical protein